MPKKKSEATTLLEAEMLKLEREKEKIDHDQFKVEKQIFNLETRYLESTVYEGNALTGWDAKKYSKQMLKKYQQPQKAVEIDEELRYFSKSYTRQNKKC